MVHALFTVDHSDGIRKVINLKKSHLQLGRKGERLAADFLQKKGYQIVERNYRGYRGEIDIIAQDGNYLVFVEVKTGRSQRFGDPIWRVDRRKQRQLGKVALAYFQEKDLQEQDCRFDVITVTFTDGTPQITHIENAFWLEDEE
ncbi:YraN family protein [candidate division KSB1 bacterium 4484_219]|nr:YraN family protein [bacterium]OQX58964.1 MAG: YraN family protein [candidate division KSB1 bacterium 4484_219]RKY86334.1 MAG: YraN family protein [candidate division KSB1 bacterium]HDI52242.1 YraN family protein [Bacteroidota bacterium]